MLRRWLTCANAAGIVVVAVLAVGLRRDAKPAGSAAPEAPPLPTERDYVELQPQIAKELGDLAVEFQRTRARDGTAQRDAAKK